jgi:mRNA interferase MazF
VILSPAVINEPSPVVLIAAISSRKTERIYPFEVLIEPPDGGLSQRSKVLLLQIRSVSKRRLLGRYGEVAQATLDRIDAALRVATGLTPLERGSRRYIDSKR